MGILSQIGLLFRGQAREGLQRLVDPHGLDIAGQGIVEAEQALVAAKRELAGIILQRRRFEAEAARLAQHLATRSQDGQEALARGDEVLAMRVAEDVVRRQQDHARASASAARLLEQEQALRDSIKGMACTVDAYRAEYLTLRALDAAARARGLAGAVMDDAGRQLGDLHDILQRVRSLQEDSAERARVVGELERELNGEALDEALTRAGIGGRQPAVRALLEAWSQAPATDAP